MLREDISIWGRPGLRDVEAQQRVVQVIRRLDEAGEIIIAREVRMRLWAKVWKNRTRTRDTRSRALPATKQYIGTPAAQAIISAAQDRAAAILEGSSKRR